MRAASIATLLSLTAHAIPALADGGPEVVAVFAIRDSSGTFSSSEVDQLTSYFVASIATNRRFKVVPRSELQAALQRQKTDSYRACYDEACQIEIGKSLAAEKVVVSEILKVGSQCAAIATLYDLRRSASEGSARAKSECTKDAVVEALERVAGILVSVEPSKTSVRQEVVPESPRDGGASIAKRKDGEATLRITTRESGGYELSVKSGAGASACPVPVTKLAPCTLEGLAPGPVEVNVGGDANIQETVSLARRGTSILIREPASLLTPAMILLGVGAAALAAGPIVDLARAQSIGEDGLSIGLMSVGGAVVTAGLITLIIHAARDRSPYIQVR